MLWKNWNTYLNSRNHHGQGKWEWEILTNFLKESLRENGKKKSKHEIVKLDSNFLIGDFGKIIQPKWRKESCFDSCKIIWSLYKNWRSYLDSRNQCEWVYLRFTVSSFNKGVDKMRVFFSWVCNVLRVFLVLNLKK